jgi:hypothetical protein
MVYVMLAAGLGLFVVAALWIGALAIWRIVWRPSVTSVPGYPEPPLPSAVITLVHGTWAPRAPWTRSDSELCRTLQHTLAGDAVFRAFRWSGRNSFRARRKAAGELRIHLHQSLTKWPEARHYIIGHSHGGNVMFYALRDHELGQAVHGVVCLSTPFIHARPRVLGRLTGLIRFAAPFGILLYASLLLDALWPRRAEGWDVLLFFTSIVGACFAFLRWDTLVDYLLKELTPATLDRGRVLIIRAGADEASLGLAVLPIISWAISHLWLLPAQIAATVIDVVTSWAKRAYGLASRLKYWAAGGLALALIGGITSSAMQTGPKTVQYLLVAIAAAGGLLALTWLLMMLVGSAAAYLVLFGWIMAAVVFAPFPLLFALALLPFGVEFAAAGLVLELTAETTPPGTWTVHHIESQERKDHQDTSGESLAGIAPAQAVLMHSQSYTDPSALQVLARWMKERQTSMGR